MIAVLGCPNLVAPPFGWTRRQNQELLVGCDSTRQTWTLRCQGNSWEGVIGNCSQGNGKHFVCAYMALCIPKYHKKGATPYPRTTILSVWGIFIINLSMLLRETLMIKMHLFKDFINYV